MNRRSFIASLAAAPATKNKNRIVLEAIAAPHMPARLTVPDQGLWGKPSIIELRTYRPAPPDLSLFEQAGIEAIPYGPAGYLIPFRDLNHRQNAWNQFNAGPAWIRTRHLAAVQSISLWRPIA